MAIYIKDNVDGGSDTISYSFTSRAPVLATIVGVTPSSLSAGTATDVIVTFSEPIASITTAGITLTGVGTLDNARFSFPYLGDNTKARIGITSTSVTGVTFANIVDLNEGAAASPSASISTATALRGLQYGNKLNYAYASNLITDTGYWTWQMWVHIPSAAGYAIGGHLAGIEWHDAGDTRLYLEPGPAADNINYMIPVSAGSKLVGNGAKRLTITRSGTTFQIYINGTLIGSKVIPEYVFGTNFRLTIGLFNSNNIYSSTARIFNVLVWDTLRTGTQIGANDFTGALHFYTLDGTLADSVGTLHLTAAGTPTYIARL